MPSVPRYSQPTVEVNRAPQVRSNISAPAEAFGGGSGTALAQAGQAVGDVGNVVTEQIVLANQARNREYEQKVMAFEAAQYQDGGAFLSKGGEIFKAREDLENNLKKLKNEMIENAPSEFQKQYIEKMTQERFASLQKSFNNHFAGESTKYFKGQNDAGIDLAKYNAEMSYYDPKKREQAWRDIEQRVIDNGRLLGLSGKEIAKNIQENKAELNYRIAARYVQNKQVDAGWNFYQNNKDQFMGKHLDTDKLFNDAKTGSRAEEIARMVSEGAIDMNVALQNLDAIKGITDEEREKAIPKIERRIKIKNETSQRRYDEALTVAVSTINDYGDFDQIPYETKALLPKETQKQLVDYARFKAGTLNPAKAGGEVFVKYNTMTAAQLSNVSQQQLVIAAKDMTPEEFKRVSEDWKNAREGISGNDKSRLAFESKKEDQEYILNKMKDLNLADRGNKLSDISKDEELRANYYAIESKVSKEIERLNATKPSGGKATPQEVKETVDNVMKQFVVEKSGWIFKTENKIPTASLNPVTYTPKESEEKFVVSFVRQNYPMLKGMSNEDLIKKVGPKTMKELVVFIKQNGLESESKIQAALEIIRKGKSN